MWFRCREGFLYRCAECDQIFMLVRLVYDVDEEVAKEEGLRHVAWDDSDMFDMTLLERAHRMFNTDDLFMWTVGMQAYRMMYGHMIEDVQYPSSDPTQIQREKNQLEIEKTEAIDSNNKMNVGKIAPSASTGNSPESPTFL
eukprot:Filipodium_phascolosomae@DN735_c0_g1_i3.p2